MLDSPVQAQGLASAKYRKQATNRAHLTFIFSSFEVGTTIFQLWYLNKINGSLNISAEK